jgi:subtilase family serine protease
MSKEVVTGLLPPLSRRALFFFPILCALLLPGPAGAEPEQRLAGNARASASAAPVKRMASNDTMRLSIGLPLRNQAQLKTLIANLYDRSSSQYGQFLTTAQFTEKFGPSEKDYQAVIGYAQSNGLKVVGEHANRMLVEVESSADQVEQAFGVKLNWYQHPTEDRLYYATSNEPTLRLATPVLHVSGLDNYVLPRPRVTRNANTASASPQALTGSGTNGTYLGTDFRKAYAPNTSLTGAGQSVGLVEFSGYYLADITKYAKLAGMSVVPLNNVMVDNYSGYADPNNNIEVALDIEVAMAMAPGLDCIYVYEAAGSSTANIEALLNRMATDNLSRQLSCSWGFDISTVGTQIFMQYAAQGQACFLASGDSGAFTGPVLMPSDDPYLTVVGGTTLTTGTGGARVSETTWSGTGGGISTLYSIPDWQAGVSMSANGGSTTMRNLPDVAMVATNVEVVCDNVNSYSGGYIGTCTGTSIAAPLWAGYLALANQRASILGKPSLGYLNPILYSVAMNSATKNCFYDITSGNNATSESGGLYKAVSGYDLVTGWGSPAGTNLFDALLGVTPADSLAVDWPSGFTSYGPIGGSFSIANRVFNLTNTGFSSLDWSATNEADFLTVSPSSGTLEAGESATVTVSLATNTTSLLLGQYSGTVTFVNNTENSSQPRLFKLLVGNPGFETSDFSYWTTNFNTSVNEVISYDWSQFTSSTTVSSVGNDSDFVHSGFYGAFLGQSTNSSSGGGGFPGGPGGGSSSSSSPGTISQSMPTVAGQPYVISFWLANPASGTPNGFKAAFSGKTIFNGSNLGAFSMTNYQFLATASNSTSTLTFTFNNEPNAFGLDDISVQAVAAPKIQSWSMVNGAITFTWSTTAGVSYQVQYTDNLVNPAWTALNSAVKAAGTRLSVTDSPPAQRFYRVIIP